MINQKFIDSSDVQETDNVDELWLYNKIPSQQLKSHADVIKDQEWRFIVDNDFKIVYKESKKDAIKILTTSQILTIPNYIRYRQTTRTQVNKDGERVRVMGMDVDQLFWFYNKKKYQLISSKFLLEWFLDKGYDASVLTSPTPEQSHSIKKTFEKKPNEIKHTIKALNTRKELNALVRSIEDENSAQILFGNAKKIEESMKIGPLESSLYIVLKTPIQVGDQYRINSITFNFENESFKIRNLHMTYRDEIQFNMDARRNVIYITGKRIKGKRAENTNDTTHVIEYKHNTFPIQVGQIKLAGFYSKCGACNTFKLDSNQQLVPRKTVYYSSLPPVALDNGRVFYHVMAYVKRYDKKLYNQLWSFLSEELELDKEEAMTLLLMNFQPLGQVENVMRHNLEIHDNLMNVIEQCNNGEDIIKVLNDFRYYTAQMRFFGNQ